jgi:hypothetical protein
MELRHRLLAVHQRHSAGGTAVQPPVPGGSEAFGAPGGEATPLPQGPGNNAFFNCLFLNKLPWELRILLSEADMADKQALGARADLFAAHNHKQAHGVVAAVAAVSLLEPEGEETTCLAIYLLGEQVMPIFQQGRLVISLGHIFSL